MNEQNAIVNPDGTSMSLVEKLVNVITAPSAVFAQIREKVTWQDWLIPFLVAVVFVGVSGIVSAPYNLEMTKSAMKAQQENFMQRDMPQEQKESMQERFQEQVEKQEARYSPPKVYYWSFLRALGGIGVAVMILAGLYFFSGNTIIGGEAKFPQILAVVSLPQMVKVIESLYNMLFIGITKNADVPASLAVILPYSPENFMRLEKFQQALYTLLSQINVFTVWRLALFTIGFSIIYKVSKGKSSAVVFGLWALWLLITTAGTFLFAGFAGS